MSTNSSLLFFLLLFWFFWFESEYEKCCVANECHPQGHYCVHEDPQLQLLVSVAGQPLQDLVLVKQRLSVDAGELPPEVDQGWQLVNPVFLGVSWIIDLDKGDVKSISLIINLLKTRNNLITLNTVVLIYKEYFEL